MPISATTSRILTSSAPDDRFGVTQLQKQERNRIIAWSAAIAGLTILTLLVFLVAGIFALAIGGIIILSGVLTWIWRQPVRGVYILFGAAVALEAQFNPGIVADWVAQYLPFFQDLRSSVHINVIVSPAEFFMALMLLIWLLKGIANRNFSLDRGSLMRPIGLYMLMVLVAELHGIGSGGDLRTSLWEVRSQVYMFVVYLLTCNLVKTRDHIWTLFWILTLGSGVRAIEGTIRYLMFIRGTKVGSDVPLYSHEQAFFLNALITFTLIIWLYGGARGLRRACLILMPIVIYIDLVSNRRAAILALGVAVLALLVATLAIHRPRRRLAALLLAILAVTFPPYYATFQDKYGSIAGPARAIASNFKPDPRDFNSNLYRTNEDKDIMASMRSTSITSIIGYGFGKPMLTPYPLPGIETVSKAYPFWNIMPHDSILWIWMRMGTIGFILLWFMIGGAIVQAMKLMKRLRDPTLRGLALFVALMLLQEVVFGYLDLQWSNYRNLVTVGVLFALVSRLDLFVHPTASLVEPLMYASPVQKPAESVVTALSSSVPKERV